MRKLVGFGAAMGIALVVASPVNAHWGASSGWAVVGGSAKYCEHSHSGFDYRKARVRAVRFATQICSEMGCFYITNDDAEVRNDTRSPYKADILLAAFDINNPRPTNGGFAIPYLAVFQDVPAGSKRWLSSQLSYWYHNIEASCQVSNNM